MPVRLFVGNLPYDTTEAELREHFGTVGPLSHVFMPVDRETGRPRGFAFVEFAERELADAAVARLHGQPFRGRTLSVSEARAREDRPGGPGRPPGPPGPRPAWAPRPPAPGFGAPPGATADRPGERRGRREFGPDAPPKGRGKPVQKRREERAGGPIPIRGGGRIYDVDDIEDQGSGAEAEVEFDDPSRSQPDDEPEGQGSGAEADDPSRSQRNDEPVEE